MSTSSIDDFQRLMGLPETLIRVSDVVKYTMTSLVGIDVVMTNQIRIVRRHDPYFHVNIKFEDMKTGR